MSHGLAYLACIVMLMYSQVTQENIAKENDFEKYKVPDYLDEVSVNESTKVHSRSKRAATTKNQLWPNGIIPYEIDDKFNSSQRMLMLVAMRTWEADTCVQFVPRRPGAHHEYIKFIDEADKCTAYIGRHDHMKERPVNLHPSCLIMEIVLHELGHVLGFNHEHTRPDRDDYIRVNYDNIDKDDHHQFEKVKTVDSLNEPYDFASIMHYSSKGHAIDRNKMSIEPLLDKYVYIIDKRIKTLSKGDTRQASLLYKCPTCGRTLQQTHGDIWSPLIRYDSASKECIWRISATPDERISISVRLYVDESEMLPFIKRMNTREYRMTRDQKCSRKDYVEIRDGPHFRSPLLKKVCLHDFTQHRNYPGRYTIKVDLVTQSYKLWFKYSSVNNILKFFASYKVLCGGILEMESGNITSPNYPNYYFPGRECIWKIKVRQGWRIVLAFQDFQLAANTDGTCAQDYLEVRDGGHDDSPPIHRLCGSDSSPPADIVSTGNEIRVKFSSAPDSLERYAGFRGHFWAEPVPAKCGANSQQRVGSFWSPVLAERFNSRGNPRMTTCLWRVSVTSSEVISAVIMVYVKSSILDRLKRTSSTNGTTNGGGSRACDSYMDYLVVEGGRTICLLDLSNYKSSRYMSYMKMKVLTKANELSIKYYSFSNHLKFKVKYHAVCGRDIYADEGVISSPTFPPGYHPEIECVWRIRAKDTYNVSLSFTHFQMNSDDLCSEGRLEVRDGYTSDAPLLISTCDQRVIDNHLVSTGNDLYVKFTANASMSVQNFSASFATEGNECLLGVDQCDHLCKDTKEAYECACETGFMLLPDGRKCQDCGATFRDRSGSMTSPRVHNSKHISDTFKPTECIWKITGVPRDHIRLSIDTIPTWEANRDNSTCRDKDRIEVSDGLAPNVTRTWIVCFVPIHKPIVITSTTHNVLVRFISILNHRQFHINYQVICGVDIEADNGNIISPLYDDGYFPEIHCIWRIKVKHSYKVLLSFDKIEMLSARVTIRDGTSASSPLLAQYEQTVSLPDQVVTSSGREMYVEFRTSNRTSSYMQQIYLSFISVRNECELKVDTCAQQCLDTTTHYRCACDTGNKLLPDKYNCTECRDIIEQRSGTIKSPYVFNSRQISEYFKPTDCFWTIMATPTERIELKIIFKINSRVFNKLYKHLDTFLSYEDKCKAYDSVEVRDNTGSIFKFCAFEFDKMLFYSSMIKSTFTKFIRGSNISIQYTSVTNKLSFEATYEVICGGHLAADNGTFASPDLVNLTRKYASNVECVWVVKVAEGHSVFLTFNVEEMGATTGCIHESVELRDGDTPLSPRIDTLCRYSLDGHVKSTGNHVFIKFKSGGKFKTQFKASFISVTNACGKHECDQKCVSERMGYRCACEENFVLLKDGRTCRDPDNYVVTGSGSGQGSGSGFGTNSDTE